MLNLAVSPDATGLSEDFPPPALQPRRTTGVPLEAIVDAAKQLGPERLDGKVWARQPDNTYSLVPENHPDPAGIVRNGAGIPQTEPGTITPLCRLELRVDIPAHDEAGIIGIGLAASAWASVGGEATTDGRDVVIVLVEDACPTISDTSLYELFCIAEHELQPARDRVAVRLANDPDFTARFAKARAIMTAASVYFPWDKGDGSIPW